MATFRFRLATLLRLREATRDERRADLAQALEADARLQARELAIAAELEAIKAQQRERTSRSPAFGHGTEVPYDEQDNEVVRGLDVDWLLDAQRYELALGLEQKALAADRQVLAKEIEKRRQALVEADREVRVLEKLRDVQQERHRAKEEHQEMKQIDEAATRAIAESEHRDLGASVWAE
jgi:flagellar export protein FliJ